MIVYGVLKRAGRREEEGGREREGKERDSRCIMC